MSTRTRRREGVTAATQRLRATFAAVLVLLTGTVAAGADRAAAAPAAAVVSDSGCIAHTLQRNDDGSTGSISLPFSLNFYGRKYQSIYVNNNGNVTFGSSLSTYTPFRITSTTPPIIAAFLADVDTRVTSAGITSYGVTSYAGRPAFCVTWRRVGYYSGGTDKTNTFQLLLVNTNRYGDFDIVMNYDKVSWESGTASGGSGGLGGTSAGAGFSNGDGNPAHFYEQPGSLQNGAFLDSSPSTGLANNTNAGVRGRYVFHIASGGSVSLADVCTPYTFVSVRGSGEKSSGVEDTGGSAVNGAVYSAMLDRYLNSAHGSLSKITFYQLPYAALSVNVLGENLGQGSLSQREDQFFNSNLPRYLESIDEGIDQLNGYVASVLRTCAAQHKTTKFLFVGYSQGALVIHKYLNLPAAGPDVQRATGYVGLIADPARIADSKVAGNDGTAAPASYGVCEQARRLIDVDNCSTGQRDVPSAFRNRTYIVCDSADIVCDTSTALDLSHIVGGVKNGMRIHTTYTTARGATELAALGHRMVTTAAMS